MKDVVEARPEQVDAIAGALTRALAGDPLTVYCLEGVPDPLRRLERLFCGLLRFALAAGVVYVPAGDPVGAAICWRLPTPTLAPEVAATVEPPEVALGTEAAARFEAAIGHAEERLSRFVPPPAWYLPVLGVEASSQRRGIGSALARAFLARAEADRLAACWDTWNRPNVAFYRRLGGDVIGDGVAPGTNLTYWLFRWDPAAVATGS